MNSTTCPPIVIWSMLQNVESNTGCGKPPAMRHASCSVKVKNPALALSGRAACPRVGNERQCRGGGQPSQQGRQRRPAHCKGHIGHHGQYGQSASPAQEHHAQERRTVFTKGLPQEKAGQSPKSPSNHCRAHTKPEQAGHVRITDAAHSKANTGKQNQIPHQRQNDRMTYTPTPEPVVNIFQQGSQHYPSLRS